MKSVIFGALLAAAASLQAIPCAGQTFTAAPGRTFSMDLDTMSGNYSVWELKDLSGVTAVRAKLAVRRLGEHKTYAPTFRISVANGDGSVGFRAAVLKRGRQRMIVLYADHISGENRTEEMFLTQIELDEVVDLAIDWSTTGEVRFALTSKATRATNGGAEIHTVKLGKAPAVLRITNSTSELEVVELSAGTATH